MPDVNELLQRKLDEAIVPEVTFEGFLRRRQRVIRRKRLAAGIVAIVVAVASLGVILRAIDRSTGVPAATPTLAPTVVALEPPGTIAFVGRSASAKDGSVYIYDPPSGTVSRLVDLRCTKEASGALRCPGHVTGLSFSPDGTRLAYSLHSERNVNYTSTPADDGLYVMDLRTGISTRIRACARPCRWISGAAWSPDGSSIAYAVSSGLHVIAPDGSGDRGVYIGDLAYDSLAWSPDGSRIVFAANGLFMVSADGTSVDGSELQRVDIGPAAADAVLWGPSWSADGRSIAFIGAAQHESRGSVWITDLGGDTRRLRALGVAWQRGLSWSTDGSHLAVVSEGELITIRPDGTGREDLTKTWSGVAPAWYPAT